MKPLHSDSSAAFSIVSMLAAFLLLAGWTAPAFPQEADSAADKAEDAAEPKTHEVKAERLKLELKLDGTFESAKTVEVSLRPEEWSKLEVQEAQPHGAAVKKGDPLVRLDLDDLQKAIQAAEQAVVLSELSLQESRLSLEALRTTTPIDLAAAERAAKEAQDDLDYFLKVTKERSIKSAEHSLRNAQYSLEYAQEELNQLRQMYKADDITEETEEIILKRAERGVVSAKFSLESSELSTKRTLETTLPRQEQSLKDTTTKQLAGQERARVSLSAATKKAEIALEKQMIEHRTTVEKLKHLQDDLKLLSAVTSPIDGYVFYGRIRNGSWAGMGTLEVALQPGGSLPAKQVFMTVVAPGAARFHTTVAEKDLFQVHANLSGHVKAVAFPEDSFPAKVEIVSRVPSSPGSFDCVVGVADAGDSPILSGMKGSVTIITYDKPEALLVPQSAVFSDDDGDTNYVFVVDGKTHSRQEVTTGRSKDSSVEILEGLKAGSRILTKKP